MKRFIFSILILTLAFSAWAEDFDFDPEEILGALDIVKGFEDDLLQPLANSISSSLLTNAALGNQWSDAYIGQFPHLGIGQYLGVVTFPVEPVFEGLRGLKFGDDDDDDDDILETLEELAILETLGMPWPFLNTSIRIGGFVFPFDAGIKFGRITETFVGNTISLFDPDFDGLGDLTFEYTVFGVDGRYALVKEKGLLPDISVGLGLNFLKSKIKLPLGGILEDLTGFDLQEIFEGMNELFDMIPDIPSELTHIGLKEEPVFDMGWGATSLDLTAQVSKRLLFIRPYIGAGLSLGKSHFSTSAKIEIEQNFKGIRQHIKDNARELAKEFAKDSPEIDIDAFTDKELDEYIDEFLKPLDDVIEVFEDERIKDGIGIAVEGVSIKPEFRLYAGISLDIFFLMLDIQAIVIPQNKTFGASLGLRLQF